MGPEEEAGHHAEVATTAANSPEQIRMCALAGGHDTAIGEDDVRFQEIVDRQTVLAREIARPAAERESRNAC